MSDIGKTILAQLGGNKFVTMTGAKNFVYGDNRLSFAIGKNSSKANRVSIEYLPGSDLYTITFARMQNLDYKIIRNVHNVYFDSLQSIFTEFTGMHCSM